jgi:hypothetical protein
VHTSSPLTDLQALLWGRMSSRRSIDKRLEVASTLVLGKQKYLASRHVATFDKFFQREKYVTFVCEFMYLERKVVDAAYQYISFDNTNVQFF